MKANGTRVRLAAAAATAIVALLVMAVPAVAAPMYEVQPAIDPGLAAALVDVLPDLCEEVPVPDEGPFPDAGGDEAYYPEDVPDDGADEGPVPSDEETPTVPDGGADEGPVPSDEETPTVPDDGNDEPADRDHLPFTGGNDMGWTVVGLGLLLLGFAVGAASIPGYKKDRAYRY